MSNEGATWAVALFGFSVPVIIGLFLFGTRALKRWWSRGHPLFRHVIKLLEDIAGIAFLLLLMSLVLRYLSQWVSLKDNGIGLAMMVGLAIMAGFLACRAAWRVMGLARAYRLAEQQRQHRFYSAAYQREHRAPLDLRLP